MKKIPDALLNISRGSYSVLGYKGLCGIYFRQSLSGMESRTSGADSSQLKCVFFGDNHYHLIVFASFLGNICPFCDVLSLQASHLTKYLYIYDHIDMVKFLYFCLLNHCICYQLSSGKTAMESKHVLINLMCKEGAYTLKCC